MKDSIQDIERKLALAYRMERIGWVLLLAGSIGFCFTVYLYFPQWLPSPPEHWPASTLLIKPL